MKNSYYVLKLAFLMIILPLLNIQCQKKQEHTERDIIKWNSDTNGCSGERKKLIEQDKWVDQNLLRKTEGEIKDFFGKPQSIELYQRGQKFYYYNIACDEEGNVNQQLRLRFNAIGSSSEMTVVSR